MVLASKVWMYHSYHVQFHHHQVKILPEWTEPQGWARIKDCGLNTVGTATWDIAGALQSHFLLVHSEVVTLSGMRSFPPNWLGIWSKSLCFLIVLRPTIRSIGVFLRIVASISKDVFLLTISLKKVLRNKSIVLILTHSLFKPDHTVRWFAVTIGTRLYSSTNLSETKSPAKLPVSKSTFPSTLTLSSCQGREGSVTERKLDEVGVDVGVEDNK